MQSKRVKWWSGATLSMLAGAMVYGYLRLSPPLLAQSDTATTAFEAWRDQPPAAFAHGKEVFHKVMDTLRTRYVDQGISEDEIYRAATMGLLEHIGEGHGDPWNKLLTPMEEAELLADVKGEVVGIGVDFRFEDASGMGVVNQVLPGTPAETAGLRRDDRILKVNGHAFMGKQIRDMVYAIRGKVGTEVTLTILRDAEIFPVTLTRAAVPWENVEAEMTDDGIGVLGIRSFTDKTPADVRDAVIRLRDKGLKSLIVDLRQCPGGSFKAAVATTSLFLRKGAPVVRIKERDGKETVKTAAADPLMKDLPLGVVMGSATSSGCELMAGGLRQSAGAVLIGAKTNGKWSMQSVETLPNHYAMKFTIARFYPPDGSDYMGKGLSPDVPVAIASESGQTPRIPDIAERLATDPVLQAARRYMGVAKPQR